MDFNKQTLHVTEFTKDMLQTLIEYFDFFADDEGVLVIEINQRGIWVEEPNTRAKKFIGKARHSQENLENMRIAVENREKH